MTVTGGVMVFVVLVTGAVPLLLLFLLLLRQLLVLLPDCCLLWLYGGYLPLAAEKGLGVGEVCFSLPSAIMSNRNTWSGVATCK